MDFPRAWVIARRTPIYLHDKKCSYYQSRGGLLCDCPVITKHPEYTLKEKEKTDGTRKSIRPNNR